MHYQFSSGFKGTLFPLMSFNICQSSLRQSTWRWYSAPVPIGTRTCTHEYTPTHKPNKSHKYTRTNKHTHCSDLTWVFYSQTPRLQVIRFFFWLAALGQVRHYPCRSKKSAEETCRVWIHGSRFIASREVALDTSREVGCFIFSCIYNSS